MYKCLYKLIVSSIRRSILDFGWGFLECDFFLTNIPLNEFSVIDFLLITYIVSLRKKILMTKKN